MTAVAGDSAAPSGGSISYSNGFHTPSNVDLTLVDGSDGGSGVDSSTELLMRAEAPFSAGTCGSFGSFTTIVTDPALSYTDTSVTEGATLFYVVRSVDTSFNRSGPSAEVHAIIDVWPLPSAANPEPSAPTEPMLACLKL